MNPDDDVCLCFHVSLRKVRSFLAREDPPVASLISDCLGAGTGCRWCVPFLTHLHRQHQAGATPDLRVSPEHYASARVSYKATQTRDPDLLHAAGVDPAAPDAGAKAASPPPALGQGLPDAKSPGREPPVPPA